MPVVYYIIIIEKKCLFHYMCATGKRKEKKNYHQMQYIFTE